AGVERRARPDVGPVGEVVLLRLLGREADVPVVDRGHHEAPGGRAAALAEAPADLPDRVEVEPVAAEARRARRSQQAGEVVERLLREPAQPLRLRRAPGEHGSEGFRPLQELLATRRLLSDHVCVPPRLTPASAAHYKTERGY